ncbi:MAG TPA: hypothetical protein VNT53_06920 [Pseudolysinimonas sp.]|nr:hypothetical protein [Pseudolysinimonas sp.]
MPELQKHRIISIASIAVMLLIPLIGWFLVAQPQFASASAANEQRASTDEVANSSRAAVAKLKADSENIDALNEQLDKLRSSIPAGVDSSRYIEGLNALALVSGVTITSIKVDQAEPYAPAVPPAAAAPEGAAAGGASPSPTPSGTPTPAATVPPAPNPAIVTNSLITPGSFVTIPVQISVAGSWDAILGFLQGLQNGDRLFLVSKIGTTTSEGGLTGDIGGFIYAIPGGTEGKPAPVSTTVKKMDVPAPVVTETPTPDPTASGTPQPNPTGSATPTP